MDTLETKFLIMTISIGSYVSKNKNVLIYETKDGDPLPNVFNDVASGRTRSSKLEPNWDRCEIGSKTTSEYIPGYVWQLND